MKTLVIIRKKMVVSVVQSMGIFFSEARKKSVVSVMFKPSRSFLVFRHILKAGEIE